MLGHGAIEDPLTGEPEGQGHEAGEHQGEYDQIAKRN